MILSNYLVKAFQPLVVQKVILNLFTKSDINDVYISWLNDPIVTRFSNQRFYSHTYETSLAYFNSFRETDNLLIKIERKSDNSFIGTMTIYYSNYHGTADIGIMLGDKSTWGKGYGWDAWNTQLPWLSQLPFIRKITAGTMRANSSMMSLLKRSGMTLEAVRFGQELLDGKPQDIVYYCFFPRDSDY